MSFQISWAQNRGLPRGIAKEGAHSARAHGFWERNSSSYVDCTEKGFCSTKVTDGERNLLNKTIRGYQDKSVLEALKGSKNQTAWNAWYTEETYAILINIPQGSSWVLLGCCVSFTMSSNRKLPAILFYSSFFRLSGSSSGCGVTHFANWALLSRRTFVQTKFASLWRAVSLWVVSFSRGKGGWFLDGFGVFLFLAEL